MTFTDPHDDIANTLRGELHARAAHLVQTPAPFARIETAVHRDRIRRRSLAGCAGVALVAALATSVTTTINGVHRTDSLQAASGSSGRSPLLDMAPRGNLVADATFMQEVAARLGTNTSILYANDDGQHTVVIGGSYESDSHEHSAMSSVFTVLVGEHGASVADLRLSDGVSTQSNSTPETYSYVGEFTGTGGSVPYVLLGPIDMTEADIATGIQLTVHGGKLAPQHTGIEALSVQDGAVEGEIADPSTTKAAARIGTYFSIRAKLSNGSTLDADPLTHVVIAQSGANPTSPAYDSLRAAIVSKGRTSGLPNLQLKGPGGDAVTDNAAQVVSDVADIAGVDPGQVEVKVEWVGQETSAWDTALLDIDVRGLPHIQAFVRGLAPGRPDSESPGLAESFVRPAQTLTPSHLPETAAAFGGTPELSTLGAGVVASW